MKETQKREGGDAKKGGEHDEEEEEEEEEKEQDKKGRGKKQGEEKEEKEAKEGAKEKRCSFLRCKRTLRDAFQSQNYFALRSTGCRGRPEKHRRVDTEKKKPMPNNKVQNLDAKKDISILQKRSRLYRIPKKRLTRFRC